MACALMSPAAPAYAAPVADAPPGVPSTWVRKAPGGWVFWVPTRKWTAKHSKCGLDISSPTGTMLVGIGGGPLPGPMDTEQALGAIVDAYREEGLTGVSVAKEYPVEEEPGAQTQSFLVKGMRAATGMKAMPVTAMISVRVSSTSLGNGIEASVVLAPTKDWRKQAKTLGTILKSVTHLETDCLDSAD
jgi:hypothetical protein